MHCPILNELPPPPPGRTGWPWTEESPPLPDVMPDGRPWPRISIITFSHNQGPFIEETIRSVLLQGYPNLEYIVINGDKSDKESVRIIRQYEPWLVYSSQETQGQAQAINKGWEQSTGVITAWLNASDVYRAEALHRVAETFQSHPGAVAVIGICARTDAKSNVIGRKLPKYLDPEDLLKGGAAPGQPAVFLKSCLVEEMGGLDESLQFAIDWEYWLRVGMRYPREKTVLLNLFLANARSLDLEPLTFGFGSAAASRAQKHGNECRAVLDRVFANPYLPSALKQLRPLAYSRIYWQQAYHELQAGQPKLARSSFRQAYQLAPQAYKRSTYLQLLAQTYVGSETVERLKKAPKFILGWTGGVFPLLRRMTGRQVSKVAIDKLRCQERPNSAFTEWQAYSGRTIDHFPPCRFFAMSVTDPEKAYTAFYEWLRAGLVDWQAWKIPRVEGGWADGSLVKSVFQLHQEHGITLTDFEQADPKLIEEAIGRKAKYYLDLFNTIKHKGYNSSRYPPISCWFKDGLYFIRNGHHRASALWVLGYKEVDVEIIEENSLTTKRPVTL